MAASPFFARIRNHVLQLVATIPAGKVCTFQSIGEHLDVMPRHVAYILSQLQDQEKLAHPWHRVVGHDGALGRPRCNPDGTSQADLLRAEGVLVSGSRIGSSFERIFVPAGSLPAGLSRQKRPPDAPAPKATTRRRPRPS